ncbi:MAG: TAXI family TRAP transporter solute-binding subunit, partial [Peptococcales bacterium]
NLTFCSATATGNWRLAMAAISQIITENVEGVRATAQVSPGGETESIMGVRDGILHGGVTVPLMAERFAKGGSEPFIEPFQVNHWLNLGDQYWNTLVAKESGITTIDQFVGKRIAVASPGTVNHIFNDETVFPAHGFSMDDIEPEYIDTSTAIEHIKDGNIDGMAHCRGFSGAIVELTMARDIVLAQPTEEAIKIISEKHPWAGPVEMPKDLYPDLEIPDPGLVFLVPFAAYLAPDLPEDLAYVMTKAVFENFEVLQNSADVYKDLDPNSALNGASELYPPHKGALRYYKEVNIPGWEEWEHLLD